MGYGKMVAAVVATVLSGIVAATTGDGLVDPVEWVNVTILGVGAAGVFAAPNVPGARYTKAIIAALTAALTVLASTILGGVDHVDVMQMVIAALGAVGVYAVPNEPTVGRHAAV